MDIAVLYTGPNAQYAAVGYCFGGKYVAEQVATDEVVAGKPLHYRHHPIANI